MINSKSALPPLSLIPRAPAQIRKGRGETGKRGERELRANTKIESFVQQLQHNCAARYILKIKTPADSCVFLFLLKRSLGSGARKPMSRKMHGDTSSESQKEYTLYLGAAGTTYKGNPNLDAIAQDVARAIVESGGGAFMEVRRVTDRTTPYMHIRSHDGYLNPGSVTMNALLEIADQLHVRADRVNQTFLSIYAEHPSAKIPQTLISRARGPPHGLYPKPQMGRAGRLPRHHTPRDSIPSSFIGDRDDDAAAAVGYTDERGRGGSRRVQQQQHQRVRRGRGRGRHATEQEDEEEEEEEDDEEQLIDTDAEQEDIMRRAERFYQREHAVPRRPGGARVSANKGPPPTRGRGRGRGDDDDDDDGGYTSEGQRVLPGLGRLSNRVMGKRRKGAQYFADPGLASIYGNANASLLGDPSDGEDGPIQRAGLDVDSENSDDAEGGGGASRNRQVVVPRAFDPDFDVGVTKFTRNPRKVVLQSVSESKFVTRDAKKMQKKIEEEVKNRSDQTRRLKEQMMRDKELHGDEIDRPVDERKLIKRSVDPVGLQKQMEQQRRAWEQNVTRRIPSKYRDGTGLAFQQHAATRQYNESDRVRKLDADHMVKMQKLVGRERSRLNRHIWAPDTSDGEESGDDDDGYNRKPRQRHPRGLPSRADFGAGDFNEDEDEYGEEGGGEGSGDDPYHEHGFALTDDEGEDEDRRGRGRGHVHARGNGSSSSRGRASDNRKVQISHALYADSHAAAGRYEDDDATSGEEEEGGEGVFGEDD